MAMIYAQSRSEMQTAIISMPLDLEYNGGGGVQLLDDSNSAASMQYHQLDGSVICNVSQIFCSSVIIIIICPVMVLLQSN